MIDDLLDHLAGDEDHSQEAISQAYITDKDVATDFGCLYVKNSDLLGALVFYLSFKVSHNICYVTQKGIQTSLSFSVIDWF